MKQLALFVLPLALAEIEMRLSDCSKQFNTFIEGAAVDKAGQFYATGFGIDNTIRNQIGKVTGECEMVAEADQSAELVGLRVLPDGNMLVTDIKGKRLLLVTPEVTSEDREKSEEESEEDSQVSMKEKPENENERVICDGDFLQPNDMAITKTGIIFLSGQVYNENGSDQDGELWKCVDGKAEKLEMMGRTNGIELSPDDSILYVSEHQNQDWKPIRTVIWKYDVSENGALGEKTLFHEFPSEEKADADGMRTDIEGNLYVARYGAGSVAVLDPSGNIKETIKVPMEFPANLEFGGDDGKTLVVVGSCRAKDEEFNENVGCVATGEVPSPGRWWSNLQDGFPENVTGDEMQSISMDL